MKYKVGVPYSAIIIVTVEVEANNKAEAIEKAIDVAPEPDPNQAIDYELAEITEEDVEEILE